MLCHFYGKLCSFNGADTHKIDADKNSDAFIVLLWGVATVIELLIRIQTHGIKQQQPKKLATKIHTTNMNSFFTPVVVKWNNGYRSE